jgi:2-methylcitrate dehydratase PrpD
MGDNPRVNAQFSLQYCIANALLRHGSKLSHFEPPAIGDPQIGNLVEKITVIPDAKLDGRGHTALDMKVVTTSGDEYVKHMDIAPGFPGNPLTQKDHETHFWECMDASPGPFPKDKALKLTGWVDKLEEQDDVRGLIPLLLTQKP